MGIAFPQFVRPHHDGVVQETARSTRFGRLGQSLRQVGELLTKPMINLGEFLLGFLVRVWFVRKTVVPFFNSQLSHFGVANRVSVLQRSDTRKIVEKTADQQVELHPADLRHVVVFFINPRFQLRNFVHQVRSFLLS